MAENAQGGVLTTTHGLITVWFGCRWGNTPLDEARVGGSKKLIKILEDAISDKVA
ncbi:hypothetical protein Hanom_Chr08g00722651 [Helianthus anomalus]